MVYWLSDLHAPMHHTRVVKLLVVKKMWFEKSSKKVVVELHQGIFGLERLPH